VKAGYLLGTTRMRQPGVSGAVAGSRSAQTSGGVSDSLPAQNGQSRAALPFAPGTSSLLAAKAAGRSARPAAMIVRRPLSGSSRSSLVRAPELV
jgi:hypothetical protein